LHRWQSDLWLDRLQIWLTRSQWPCLWIKQVVDLLHDFVVTCFFFKRNFAVGIAHYEYHDIYIQLVRIVFMWYSVVCVASCDCTESAYVLLRWGIKSYRTSKILYVVVHLKNIPW
jgi:hypothetical protein